MGPSMVVLSKQEAKHNSKRMTERLVNGLHHYSALFDLMKIVDADPGNWFGSFFYHFLFILMIFE